MRGPLSRRPLGALLAALLLAGLGATGAAGCADTAGAPVRLPIAVVAADAAGQPPGAFTNRHGWTVTLTEALALVGPVYLLAVPEATEPGPLAWLRHLSPVGVARAHVALTGGRVLAEVLEPRVLDLLDPSATLGEARGVSGTCRQLEVHLRAPGTFAPSNPEALPRLDGQGFRVAGVAERDGLRVAFAGGLTLPQDRAEDRQVAGIPVADLALDDAARPTLRVDLEGWLWNVDFAPLAAEVDPEDPDRPVALAPGTPAHAAWQRAVSARQTWSLQ